MYIAVHCTFCICVQNKSSLTLLGSDTLGSKMAINICPFFIIFFFFLILLRESIRLNWSSILCCVLTGVYVCTYTFFTVFHFNRALAISHFVLASDDNEIQMLIKYNPKKIHIIIDTNNDSLRMLLCERHHTLSEESIFY